MSAPAKVKPAEEAAQEIEDDLVDSAIDRWSDDIRRLGFRYGEFEPEEDVDNTGNLIFRRTEDGARFEVEYEVTVRVLSPEERTHMGEVALTGRVFYAGGTEQPPGDLSEVLDRDGVPWERDAITGDWCTFGGIRDTWTGLRDQWGPLSEMAADS